MSKYRVVYYSLFLPRTHLTEVMFSGKDTFDRRVERIKRRCHCNIRTVGHESVNWKGACYMMIEIIYDKDVGNHTGCLYMIQNLFKTMRQYALGSFKVIPHQCIVKDRKGFYHTLGIQGQKEEAILKALVASSTQSDVEFNLCESALQHLRSPEFYSMASFRSFHSEKQKRRIKSNTKSISQSTGKNHGDEVSFPEKLDYLFDSQDLGFSNDQPSYIRNLSLDRTSDVYYSDLSLESSVNISDCLQNIVRIHSSRNSNHSSFRRNMKHDVWQKMSIASASSTTSYSKKSSSRYQGSLIQGRNTSNGGFRGSSLPPKDSSGSHQRRTNARSKSNQRQSPAARGIRRTTDSIKLIARSNTIDIDRYRDNLIAEVCKEEICILLEGLTLFLYPNKSTVRNDPVKEDASYNSPQLSEEASIHHDFVLSDFSDVDENEGGETMVSTRKQPPLPPKASSQQRRTGAKSNRQSSAPRRIWRTTDSIKLITVPSDIDIGRYRDNLIAEVCREEICILLEELTFYYYSSEPPSLIDSVKEDESDSSRQLSGKASRLNNFVLSDLSDADKSEIRATVERVDSFTREIQSISDGLINEVCMENAYALLIGLSRFYYRCKEVLPNTPDQTLINEMMLILEEESRYDESLRSKISSPTSPSRRVAEMMGLLIPIDKAITATEPIIFNWLYNDLINCMAGISSDFIIDGYVQGKMGQYRVIETSLLELEIDLFDWLAGNAVIDIANTMIDEWDKKTAEAIALAPEQLQDQLFEWIYDDIVEQISENIAKLEALAVDEVEWSLVDSIYADCIYDEADRIYRKNSKAITKAVREIEIELSSWVFQSRKSLTEDNMEFAKVSSCSLKIVEMKVIEWLMTIVTENVISERMNDGESSLLSMKKTTFSSNSAENIFTDVIQIGFRQSEINETINETQSNQYQLYNLSHRDTDSDEEVEQRRNSSSLENATIDKPIIGDPSSRKSSVSDAGKRCSFILRRNKILKELLNEIFEVTLEKIERKVISNEFSMKSGKVSNTVNVKSPISKDFKTKNISESDGSILKGSRVLTDIRKVRMGVPGSLMYEAEEVTEGLMRYVTISAVRKIVVDVLSQKEGIHEGKLRKSMFHLFGDSSVFGSILTVQESSTDSKYGYDDMVISVSTSKDG